MDENNSGNNEVLIGKLTQELDSARQEGDPKQICLSLEKLGQAYLDEYQAPDALSQFEEALKIIKDLDDKESEARLLGEKGLALKLLGNGPMALQSFRKSKAIAKGLNHKTLLCDSEFQIGMILLDRDEPEGGFEEMTHALDIATELKDATRKMRIAGTMADRYQADSKPELSHKYYRLAHEMAQINGNRSAECAFLTKLGNIALASGEIKNAIDLYERSLSIATELKNRNAEINILSGLFRANALAENLDLAAKYGEKVIQLSDEIQHYEAEIDNINVLATLLIDEGQYDKAQTFLEHGMELAEKQNSQEWLIALETTRGTAFYRSGDNKAAMQAYDHAVKIASKVSDQHSEARALSFLSAVQADLGDVQKAVKSAEHALLRAQEIDEKNLAAETQMLLAFYYKDLEKPAQAIQSCQMAAATYQEIGDEAMTVKAEELLEQLHR